MNERYIDIYNDEVEPAPICNSFLQQLIANMRWPANATCATQEVDGEILYWSCDINKVVTARYTVKGDKSLTTLLSPKFVIFSAYTDYIEPKCSYDWRTAVVTKKEIGL